MDLESDFSFQWIWIKTGVDCFLIVNQQDKDIALAVLANSSID